MPRGRIQLTKSMISSESEESADEPLLNAPVRGGSKSSTNSKESDKAIENDVVQKPLVKTKTTRKGKGRLELQSTRVTRSRKRKT